MSSLNANPERQIHKKENNPFKLTPALKAVATEKKNARQKRELAREERLKSEKEHARQESDKMFETWRKTKDDEFHENQRKQRVLKEVEHKRAENRAKESEPAYKIWKSKKDAMFRDAITCYHQYMVDTYYDNNKVVTSRCKSAFSCWLKQKSIENRAMKQINVIRQQELKYMEQERKRMNKNIRRANKIRELTFID